VSREAYLAALHDALDARRDPLDDAVVRDWLAAHPEDLDEFAAMRVALATAVRPLRAARRRIWPLAALPLAAAAALLLLLRLEQQPAAPRAAATTGAILAVAHVATVTPAVLVSTPRVGAGVLASSSITLRTTAF